MNEPFDQLLSRRQRITCGAWTPEGDFLELPEFDMQRLLLAWQEAVFELYLAEEKVEPKVVDSMRNLANTAALASISRISAGGAIRPASTA